MNETRKETLHGEKVKYKSHTCKFCAEISAGLK